MKKKVYFQSNIIWQLLVFLFLIACFISIFVLFEILLRHYRDGFTQFWSENIEGKIIYCLIMSAFILCPIALFGIFIQLEHYYIVLKEDTIYAPDDWRRKNSIDKIQFKTIVKYKDVKDVKIVYDYYNSKDTNGSFFKKRYIVIITNNNEEKKFFVGYFTKKSLIKIINDIKNRMRLVGNNVELKDTEEIIKNIENR